MWIESHQSLLTHRKTGRLARSLEISKITAIGHLHAFWWWSMDNAPEGYLTDIDNEDIADGSAWEGDPAVFVEALIFAGFVDRSENGHDLIIHNWMKYAGKLIEKREKDAERKRVERQKKDVPAPSPVRTDNVQRTSNGHPRDGAGTVPNRTVPNPTEPLTGGADAPPPHDSEMANEPIPIKRASRAERETRIPADFAINDDMRQWARSKVPNLDLDYAHEEFCTYWRGKGGKNLDWEQTWRNGMLKANERVRNTAPRYLSQAEINKARPGKFVGA